jgi:mediator of RNA polymerase II transcription subunit 13
MDSDIQEEPCQLLQQPLSLGYYVSTAKTGKLPKWFWTSCRHLEDCNPSFLKVNNTA